MKNQVVLITLLLILCIVTGCSDKNSTSQTITNQDVIVYKDYLGSKDAKLNMGDTITTNIGADPFTLYFDTSCDSLLIPLTTENITLQWKKHNVYECSILNAGTDKIYALPNCEEVDKNYIDHITVKIKGYKLSYLTTGDTCEIQGTSSVETEYKIRNEIHNSFFPIKSSLLSFKFVTKTKGDFTYQILTAKSDTVKGTFTTDKNIIVNNQNDYKITYQLSYQNKTQTIVLKKSEGNFYMVQDFTKYFQDEYPNAGITSVILYSRASENSSTWDIE